MTVTSTLTRKDYTLDGVVLTYPYDFKIFSATDLEVKKLSLAGIETTLTLTTDYSVTGAGTENGGNVVLVSAGTSGETLVIRRNIPLTQPTSFRNQRDFFAERHEDAYDRATMQIQQQTEESNRAILLPVTFTGSTSIVDLIPGYALGIAADGLSVVCVPNTGADQTADLANYALSTRGAGLVGYAYAVAYGANTVGKAIKDVMDRATALEAIDLIHATMAANAQCRLIYVDATHVRLIPYNGNKILINGVLRTIPAAGVTLVSTGLGATTLSYIYAFMNGATMELEGVATTHATDADNGTEIKTGDASRTLVGMTYTKVAETFADTVAQRFVASWFNRRNRHTLGAITADRTCTSTTPNYAAFNAESLVEFVSWASDVQFGVTAGVTGTASVPAYFSIGIDGVAASEYVSPQQGTAFIGVGGSSYSTVAEGYHYANMIGQLSSAGNLIIKAGSRFMSLPNI